MTVKRVQYFFLFCAFIIGILAQEKPIRQLSDAQQNPILKAQKALKSAQTEMAELQEQYAQLESKMKDLQMKAGPVSQKMNVATKNLDDAKTAAIKEAGLDPGKFEVEDDSLTIKPKSEKK